MTLLKFPLTFKRQNLNTTRKAIAKQPIDSVFSFKIVTTIVKQVISSPIASTQIISTDWGEMLNESTSVESNNYETPGTYTITITYKQGTPFFSDITQPVTDARKFLTEVVTTTNITNMSYMFYGATKFNQDISGWDTSKVTNMAGMFLGASLFNQPINTIPRSKTNKVIKWDTSKVTDMNRMFYEATAFNGDISKWNTSKVTDMANMFYGALKFNGDISKWNTSNVINMAGMFNGASLFNSDISKWNTSKVITIGIMFNRATVFNQNISKWNISKLMNMYSVFTNSGIVKTSDNAKYLSLYNRSQLFNPKQDLFA